MSQRTEDEVVWGDIEWPEATVEVPESPAHGRITQSNPDPVAWELPSTTLEPSHVVEVRPPETLPVAPPPLPPVVATIPARLVRGQRARLADLGLGPNLKVSLALATPSNLVVDVTCLGLDGNGRLSDEQYFVFYNQKGSPCGGISLLPSTPTEVGVLQFALGNLPPGIHRLIVAAAIDGSGQMSDLGASKARWLATDGPGAEFSFSGSDFAGEKALMVMEIYRKDGAWRTAALGQGFAGGLAALLAHFGAHAA